MIRIPSAPTASEYGFTLLEVVLAITFIGVIVGISIPAIATIRNRTYLRGETIAARQFLERAYGYALASRQHTIVTITHTSLTTHSESEVPLEQFSPRRNVQIRPDSVRDGKIVFYPSITASPGTLRLTRGGHECSIVISLRGRTRVVC